MKTIGLPPKEKEFLEKIARKNREKPPMKRVYVPSEMMLRGDP